MSFFGISKFIWFLVQPSSLITLVLIAGSFFLLRGRLKSGRNLVLLGLAGLLIGGLSPLGHILAVPLENRFERPALDRVRQDIGGIIVLGGANDTIVSNFRGVVTLTEAAERMTEAVSLARLLPGKLLLFSGGGAQIIYKTGPEAAAAKALFISLGVDPKRLLLENRSRNTSQNAIYTRDLLQKKGLHIKPWLLVTSAFHMPRAMGCFQKAGLKVIAWPTDYRTRGWYDRTRFFSRPSEGLRRLDMISREWLGLLAYWITGRTDRLFPAPA